MITISQPELLKLIDINPPYFAFNEVQLEDETVFAEIPVQQPMGYEAGPITAAEASRHLAILGVCSCALANQVKRRHYYLAYKGIFERFDVASEALTTDTRLVGRASCISVDRKKSEAITELRDANGNLLIRLRVFYHVIADTTFERLYKNHYIEFPDFKYENPYKLIHKFETEKIFGDEINCSMGEVPPYMCAGHFPNFPALPVAILVYNLFSCACKLASAISGSKDEAYIIREYEITADNLAFAGDLVSLNVKYIGTSGDGKQEFLAEGIANGEKSVGKINLILEACKVEVESIPSESRTSEYKIS